MWRFLGSSRTSPALALRIRKFLCQTMKSRCTRCSLKAPACSVVKRTVRDVLETLAYDFLEQTHDGWENGDGAHGELERVNDFDTPGFGI